jgi:hypothetical protein
MPAFLFELVCFSVVLIRLPDAGLSAEIEHP